MKHTLIVALFTIATFNTYAQTDKQFNSNDFFKLNVSVGERLANVFTRTISNQSDSFPEIVFRVGGTGI